MKLMAVILFFCSFNVHSECVHEKKVFGFNLERLSQNFEVLIESKSNQFFPVNLKTINPLKKYTVHLQKITNEKSIELVKDFTRYNKKHIEYYRYARIQKFLKLKNLDFQTLGYETVVVGKSIEGRDLYSVRPTNYSPNKKTIVMFGRHHGDEGTANWIIEGFVNDYLNAGPKFHEKYQLVLYPMINPDGAENKSRYNKNSRDLNRSWSADLSKSYDEARVIHTDLKKYLIDPKQVVIALDMHGSFTKDFIYRVEKDYLSTDFFNHQQEFIDELSTVDKWQNGNFELSNGHPKMARIVLINSYNLHALTHETPRDIKLKNSKSRSKKDLMEQGSAVFNTLSLLY